MIKNKYKIFILLTVMLFGFSLNLIQFSLNDFQTVNYQDTEIERFEKPQVAAALKYSDILQNATTIYRLFESINFTIDTSTSFPDASNITMEIQFSNNSVRNYEMAQVDTFEFYYEYIPEYNAPLGFQNVSFFIYNNTQRLMNNHTTFTNFTINSNCFANFYLEGGIWSNEYYLNDTLYTELNVNNFISDNGRNYEFEWDLTIVDSRNEASQQNLLNLQNNVNYFTLFIDSETFQEVNKIYYLKVNMTDATYGTRAAYFPFKVKNTKPIIKSNIILSPDEIFRTDECIVSVNASDVETTASDLLLRVFIYDSEGEEVIEKFLGHNTGNNYSIPFTIPSDRPIGNYRVNVSAEDKDKGIDWKITDLTVKNNLPEIHSYWINGLSMNQSISVFYGRNLVFSFNVSDIEGISFIKVALLNKENEWFNITTDYIGEDTIITVRTQDLIGGMWYAYIYVIDTDGAVISLIDDYDMAPQGIRIVPDVLSSYIPWIVFFVGATIGLLVGIGIIYKYFNSKYIGVQPVSDEKKIERSKKLIKKRRVKTKKIEKEPMKKEIVEPEIEETEEKEEIPKRKIKRRL